MIRFRLYYDKDKETEWLNEMAADGWALKSFFAGFYKFEPCEKGEYIYQIDLGDELYSVSDEYRELMGELGVEIVVLWGFWIILRKRAEDGPFELYTDVDSKIEHYRNFFGDLCGNDREWCWLGVCAPDQPVCFYLCGCSAPDQ